VAEYVLEDWYNGKFKDRQFTDLMRKKIFEWVEKNELKKQETVVALPVASTGAATKSMMDPPSQKPAGGDATKLSPEELYEDTKKWIGNLWGDKKTCLQELQVSEDKLKAWFNGDDKDPMFTRELRGKIKMIKDTRAVQNKQTLEVVPVTAKPAGAPVAAKQAGAPVAATGAGVPVAPREQCPACRGKHEKHKCGKQKDPVQLLTSVVRPLQSGVANSGLQPRPPAVQAPTVVPPVVRPPRATLGKRVADLEQTVKSLTADLQLLKQQLDMNTELTNLVAVGFVSNNAQVSPLNDQPAPGGSSQEGSSSSKKARLS
jgi:hypothetical protein